MRSCAVLGGDELVLPYGVDGPFLRFLVKEVDLARPQGGDLSPGLAVRTGRKFQQLDFAGVDFVAVLIGRHAAVRLVRVPLQDRELGAGVVLQVIALGRELLFVGGQNDDAVAHRDRVGAVDGQTVVGRVVVAAAGFLARQVQLQVLAEQLVAQEGLGLRRVGVADHLDEGVVRVRMRGRAGARRSGPRRRPCGTRTRSARPSRC